MTGTEERFLYGTYYYPDHWPENRWQEDAQAIQDADMNVVKTGEFAWAAMEPQEGRFDFAWLDRAIQVLRRHEIKVILGTPSASPPSWLYQEYPDIAETDRHGYLFHSGVEPSINLHHLQYIKAVRRIVTAEAEHYMNNPNVLGFSIDNEVGYYVSYDPFTQAAVREWCKRKYKTLDNLNRDWGMAYWAQTLTSWGQVPLPWYAVLVTRNPSLELDFRRFHSESVRDFVAFQSGILKRIAPGKLLTTNGYYELSDKVDYSRMYEPLDFAAFDLYQSGIENDYTEYVHSDLGSEQMRAAKGGQNFMVMETQAGLLWGAKLFPPGFIRVWDYSDIAHGADALTYFLFREAPFGAEHAQVGTVGWDNYRSARYQVITQTGSELRHLSSLLQGSKVVAPVALLMSPDTRWSFDIEKPSWPSDHQTNFDYTRQLVNFYAGFRRVAVNVDVVFPQQDFSPYKILVAPCLRVVDPALGHRLDEFVKSGGTPILSYLSGSRDEKNWNTQQTLPGLLQEMVGMSIHDFEPQSGQQQEIVGTDGQHHPARTCPASTWFDILEPTTATTLATYTKKFYAGKAAITRNQYGKGTVYYVGTEVSLPAFYEHFIETVLRQAGVTFGPTVPHGVQVATREKPGTMIIFVLNHSDQPQTVSMGHAYRNALTAELDPAELLVPAYDVKILVDLSGHPKPANDGHLKTGQR